MPAKRPKNTPVPSFPTLGWRTGSHLLAFSFDGLQWVRRMEAVDETSVPLQRLAEIAVLPCPPGAPWADVSGVRDLLRKKPQGKVPQRIDAKCGWLHRLRIATAPRSGAGQYEAGLETILSAWDGRLGPPSKTGTALLGVITATGSMLTVMYPSSATEIARALKAGTLPGFTLSADKAGDVRTLPKYEDLLEELLGRLGGPATQNPLPSVTLDF